MKGRAICFWMVLVLGFTRSAMGGGPVAVSPGGEGSIAVVGQECPTFSWSQVEGVISYRLKVFDIVGGILGSYEALEKTGGPVVSVEIKAPALSWTPSQVECLVRGGRYVWYVAAVGSDGVERWSEGRGFEVDAGVSLEVRDAVKETVNEYLVKEWKETKSYKEVKETIKAEMVKEIRETRGAVIGAGTPPMLASETGVNTLFGYQAGNSLGDNDDYATFIGFQAGVLTNDGTETYDGKGDTFVGYQAGFTNTTGYSNTFLGSQTGLLNQTGYENTFLGRAAGQNNNTGYNNTFVGGLAGRSNTAGIANTYVGISAGYSCNGSGNTFVGNYAGNQNTSGWRNVMLGEFAGQYNLVGEYNVFIGWNAGAQELGSNRLYIANSDTPIPLIYGEFDNNLVVIHGILSVASSREYKENINQLKTEEAMETLQNLKPVKFSYKVSPGERHAGFISEEVPESLTTKDRKAVSPMDIVAVLTKVVQELKAENEAMKQRLLVLEAKGASK